MPKWSICYRCFHTTQTGMSKLESVLLKPHVFPIPLTTSDHPTPHTWGLCYRKQDFSAVFPISSELRLTSYTTPNQSVLLESTTLFFYEPNTLRLPAWGS